MGPVLATSLTVCLVAAPGRGVLAPWEPQLEEMGYWIVHISAINAINGLNLSREQTLELRRLAREVEKAGAKVPTTRGRMHPDLAAARDQYRQLRATLLRQEEVGKSTERRLAQARTAHAKVITDSLKATGQDGGRCTGCHAPPAGYVAGSRTKKPKRQGEQFRRAVSGRVKDKELLAHMEGTYGWDGLAVVARLAPEVDRLLTDAQREILLKFSCCLVPPSELSDPVRAGEVDVSDKVLKLLRNCRTCPEQAWPRAKGVILDRVAQRTQIQHPGAAEAQKEAARQRVAAVLDKARAMSDMEFEMQKEALCIELKPSTTTPPADDHKRCFRAAYFLLLPGSDDLYTEVLKRITRQRAAGR